MLSNILKISTILQGFSVITFRIQKLIKTAIVFWFIDLKLQIWKTKAKIAGIHVIKSKENVIGVAVKDIVVEKVGQLEMDVMVHLVEITNMLVSGSQVQLICYE